MSNSMILYYIMRYYEYIIIMYRLYLIHINILPREIDKWQLRSKNKCSHSISFK